MSEIQWRALEEILETVQPSEISAGEDWPSPEDAALSPPLLLAKRSDIIRRPDDPGTSRLLAEVIDTAEEAVSLYDASGTILFTNSAYHRIFDHYPGPAALRGMTHEALYRLDLAAGVIDDPLAISDPEAYLRERARIFRTLRAEVTEIQTIKGRTYLYSRSRLWSGETLSRRTDITALKAVEMQLRTSQRRLEDLAFVDLMTGLKNRICFREKVDAELAAGRRRLAVVLINIDGFKALNSVLGDKAGDAVLRIAAERLRAALRPQDLPARLGGDEFAVCCLDGHSAATPERLAKRIIDGFREPFVVGDRRIPVSVSLGIASVSDRALCADALLLQAAAAMRVAKHAGGQRCRRFDAVMESTEADRRMLAVDLREAIALGQLELYYQPLMAVRGGRIAGVEALARWHHPVRGMVSPAEFIPLAEEAGLIGMIGAWVLRQAIGDASAMPPELTIAVNLSPRQLAHGDIVEMAAEIAGKTGFDLRRLELEITESHTLQDDRLAIETLSRLRQRNVGVSLDDFGTGYSSLSYLLSFPFTKIKVDKSFVGAMLHRADAAAIVAAVLDLAKRLGMVTTAEGVETREQLERLTALGCDQVQGYLIARPLPLAKLKAFLALSAGRKGKGLAGARKRSASAATGRL